MSSDEYKLDREVVDQNCSWPSYVENFRYTRHAKDRFPVLLSEVERLSARLTELVGENARLREERDAYRNSRDGLEKILDAQLEPLLKLNAQAGTTIPNPVNMEEQAYFADTVNAAIDKMNALAADVARLREVANAHEAAAIQLARDNARLCKIVDALPVTADRVPIVPGMTVWSQSDEDPFISPQRVVSYRETGAVRLIDETDGIVWEQLPSRIFTTPTAAAALSTSTPPAAESGEPTQDKEPEHAE